MLIEFRQGRMLSVIYRHLCLSISGANRGNARSKPAGFRFKFSCPAALGTHLVPSTCPEQISWYRELFTTVNAAAAPGPKTKACLYCPAGVSALARMNLHKFNIHKIRRIPMAKFSHGVKMLMYLSVRLDGDYKPGSSRRHFNKCMAALQATQVHCSRSGPIERCALGQWFKSQRSVLVSSHDAKATGKLLW